MPTEPFTSLRRINGNQRARRSPFSEWALVVLLGCLPVVTLFTSGCGTTQSRMATEQILLSAAVDDSISQIDFRDLSGRKVYLDTQFVRNVKGIGFVNADYIISSLRQQLVAAHCLIQDNLKDSDYVVEPRVGALGNNGHEISYGIPASNAISSASSLVPTMPQIPTIPELSLAKRNHQSASVKIGVFAYNRHTKHPVWQSGIAQSKSTAKDTWVLGMGPFQRGTIYEGTHFAGGKIGIPLVASDEPDHKHPAIPYSEEFHFTEPESPTMLTGDPLEGGDSNSGSESESKHANSDTGDDETVILTNSEDAAPEKAKPQKPKGGVVFPVGSESPDPTKAVKRVPGLLDAPSPKPAPQKGKPADDPIGRTKVESLPASPRE